MIFDFDAKKLIRTVGVILGIAVVVFLLGYGLAHCELFHPGQDPALAQPPNFGSTQVKVPPATPGNTLCKAELDKDSCAKFQKLLANYGHKFRVLEGTALATAKGVRQKTFVVVLKCVAPNGDLYAVGVKFVKDILEGIEVKPLGDRQLGT